MYSAMTTEEIKEEIRNMSDACWAIGRELRGMEEHTHAYDDRELDRRILRIEIRKAYAEIKNRTPKPDCYYYRPVVEMVWNGESYDFESYDFE